MKIVNDDHDRTAQRLRPDDVGNRLALREPGGRRASWRLRNELNQGLLGPAQLAEHLHPRPQRRRAFPLPRRRPGDTYASLATKTNDLFREPCLADAGLARQQHQSAARPVQIRDVRGRRQRAVRPRPTIWRIGFSELGGIDRHATKLPDVSLASHSPVDRHGSGEVAMTRPRN